MYEYLFHPTVCLFVCRDYSRLNDVSSSPGEAEDKIPWLTIRRLKMKK